VFANVLVWAAAAINQLEDGDQNKQRERDRVQNVARDKQDLARAVAAIRGLVDRYTDKREAETLSAALNTVAQAIECRLEDETGTWLTPIEGRPRRAEFDHFAQVILLLAEPRNKEWKIRRAAHAVATVVDSVWSDDARTKKRFFARNLWGETYSSNQPERIETLAEELRKRAQTLKRTLSQNSAA
jgi:hypothetical protein